MKIFSNFDTNIRKKTSDEYVSQYGEGNVLCFWRSKLYWVLKIFFPTIFLIIIASWMGYLFYYLLDGEYLLSIFLVDLCLSSFFLMPIIGKYIDYNMDFIVVTPDFLIMYDQEGILKKKVVTVNEKSIKTISVERSWLLYSLFDNGDIIFLAEGDVTAHGDITLKWIPRPEKRRNQIAMIMNKE